MLSLKDLMECFELNGGRLFWRSRPRDHFVTEKGWLEFNSKFPGQEAGTVYLTGSRSRRRVMLYLGGERYRLLTHRVVYAIYHRLGVDDLPALIDHADGDSLNNSPENLRAATPSQNNCNRRPRAGKPVPKGVFYLRRDKCFRAEISVNKVRTLLGHFKREEDAAEAYRQAAIRLHGDFARV